MIEKPYTHSAEDVLQSLSSDKENGLTSAEAEKRLLEYGLNVLGEKKQTPLWKRFLQQFADAMVIILLAAAGLSAVMALREGEFEGWIDVIVIMAIVIINAVLGVYQEGKADQAIAALRKMSSPQSKVIRDGIQKMLPSDQIVPGDIIVLDAGDLVAADIRLTWQNSLKVEEASLTGESVPVGKNADSVLPDDSSLGDRNNMLYMGTAITYGRARGVVIGTGEKTELGRIAEKLQNIDDSVTPLQKNLTSLGKVLGIICIVVCIIVFTVDVFIQKDAWDDALMTAVSLAVAAIPEGLAAVVTIVLSIGMTRMAARNAIVRKLLAVETLGSVDVICSDKTGTLTQNEMTVTTIFDGVEIYDVSGVGYSPEGSIQDKNGAPARLEKGLERLILSGVLCSDAITSKN
jgi:Ca2+-transporting ATPase